jgi:heat shock protein HslJ
MSNQFIAPRHAASRTRRLSWCAGALAAAALLAACAMPTHPDSAAPPSDPFNPAAAQLLDDTSWVLTNGKAADGRPLELAHDAGQAPVTLVFSTASGQRRASGIAGCNRFTASYALKNGALSFGPLNTTRLSCAGALGTLEHTYLDALAHVAKTGVQMHPPPQLEIVAEDGTTLTFARNDR